VIDPAATGMITLDEEARVQQIVEKPPLGTTVGSAGNGGIYLVDKEVLNYIPGGRNCDFAADIFPQLIAMGLPVYGYPLGPDDYLVDIGTLENYYRVNQSIRDGKLRPVTVK